MVLTEFEVSLANMLPDIPSRRPKDKEQFKYVEWAALQGFQIRNVTVATTGSPREQQLIDPQLATTEPQKVYAVEPLHLFIKSLQAFSNPLPQTCRATQGT
jgi:hypothetical protein